MMWLWLIPAGLAGAAAAMALVGARLPKQHRVSRSRTIAAPPEQVWAVITDFASIPTWRRDVREVRTLPAGPAGHPGYVERSRHGEIPFEVTEWHPPLRLVTRIADPKLPFGGRWIFELRAVGGGTEITLVEEGEVGPAMFRFLSRYVFGYARTAEDWLLALARHFEK